MKKLLIAIIPVVVIAVPLSLGQLRDRICRERPSLVFAKAPWIQVGLNGGPSLFSISLRTSRSVAIVNRLRDIISIATPEEYSQFQQPAETVISFLDDEKQKKKELVSFYVYSDCVVIRDVLARKQWRVLPARHSLDGILDAVKQSLSLEGITDACEAGDLEQKVFNFIFLSESEANVRRRQVVDYFETYMSKESRSDQLAAAAALVLIESNEHERPIKHVQWFLKSLNEKPSYVHFFLLKRLLPSRDVSIRTGAAKAILDIDPENRDAKICLSQ